MPRLLLFLLLVLTSSLDTDRCDAAARPLPWLHARGTDIVDSAGNGVTLRGFNLGGALVVEPWMAALDLDRHGSDLPAVKDEKTLWQVLESRFGPQRRATLQQTWRSAWANAADVQRLAEAGASVVRVPFWYAEVEDTDHPTQLLPEGAKLLDELVDACAASGVYAILDLHGAPGGQSKEDHTGEAGRNELFRSAALQQRTERLWEALARHFRDRPEVAGYDLLNEPMGAADAAAVLALNHRLYRAVRRSDVRHLVFIEDGYKGDAAFPASPARQGWTNVCFSKHLYDFNAASIEDHRRHIAQDLPKLRAQQLKWGVPLFIGEFSTITEKQGGVPAMAEYFAAFDRYGWSWTVWTYKQISAGPGLHTMWGLYVNLEAWDRPNPYTDSSQTLQAKFARYDTSKLVAKQDYLEAFRQAVAPRAKERAR
jgi:endoglucanase